ncbi:hypothetical protein ACVWWR_002962 [Bradyrhizobium sp. LM3.2]
MSWRSVIGPLAGRQLGFALGIETFEHLRLGEIGQHLADRRVQRQLALLDQLHRAR